jgi:hypothetical protein
MQPFANSKHVKKSFRRSVYPGHQIKKRRKPSTKETMKH